jgi:hypothetical protein
MSDTPIDDYLDELLRRTRADARTTRRLLDEAADHLHATAAELVSAGLTRRAAEAEAVRRFGPPDPIVRAAYRSSFLALTLETARAAWYLLGCGLLAIGCSGLVALVMNVAAGRSFVGGATALTGGHASVQETADDAVVLRGLAGVVGVLLLLAYAVWRRRGRRDLLLPGGLVDALGAAAFAAATVGLAAAAIAQARQTGTDGVGFALSGAVVALPATGYFCVRAVRALLPAHR